MYTQESWVARKPLTAVTSHKVKRDYFQALKEAKGGHAVLNSAVKMPGKSMKILKKPIKYKYSTVNPKPKLKT